MFNQVPGFFLFVLPLVLFIYAVFAGNTRILAVACLLGFGGVLSALNDTREKLYLAEHKNYMNELDTKSRVGELESKVRILEFRNKLEDDRVQRQVDELLKKK
jgi:hypothetical protein